MPDNSNYPILLIRVIWNAFQRWGLRGSVRRIARELQHESLLQAASDFLERNIVYSKWRKQHRPSRTELNTMKREANAFEYKPLISIVMPTYNTPDRFLREAIESVQNQVYDNWQLCIADDCSSEPQVRETLEEYRLKDDRIEIVYRSENGHISASSNSAIEIARGDFIAFFDHDDVLSPDALFEMVQIVNQHPSADLIYSDEDKLTLGGNHVDPFFKPDWSPDKMLSHMYTCHFSMYRKDIIDEIGGLRVGFEGSQDYDLALRFTEKTDRIYHIPKILYHWRIHPKSTSGNADAKGYTYIAGQKALQEALQRRGEYGQVEHVQGQRGNFRVRYDIVDRAKISIILPTKDLADVLEICLESIFMHPSKIPYEVLLVDNASSERKTFEIFSKWEEKEPDRFRLLEYPEAFNYSKINNFAAQYATGSYLLFLNNDIEVITKDWLSMMLEQAQRPSIGAVGCKLLFPDDSIQHAGVVLGAGDHGIALHAHKHYPADSNGYFCNLKTINNYSAVTAACLMCSKNLFEEVGGFTQELSVAYNDIDLCLKFMKKGRFNVYLPHVELYHHESKSRGFEDTKEKRERLKIEAKYMWEHWDCELKNDPFYNPNFSRKDGNFRIRTD